MQLVEPAAKGESSKGGVEVSKDLLRQGGQGVAIQGEQGEGGDPTEGTTWQRSQKIEPKVQNLQHFDKLNKELVKNYHEIIGGTMQNMKRQYDAKMCCMSEKAAGQLVPSRRSSKLLELLDRSQMLVIANKF